MATLQHTNSRFFAQVQLLIAYMTIAEDKK